jgi:hypothetical protein
MSEDSVTSSPVPADETPVFRVNLPADDDSATETFAASEALLGRLHDSLNGVPARLDGLVARQRGQGSVSFNAPVPAAESGPEADLLVLLGQADREAGISFSAGEDAVSSESQAIWEQARTGFARLLEQATHEALHFAWVETNVAGSALARTTVGWTGDAQTVFVDGVGSSQVSLHERSLRIATQTRAIHMRMFITIAAGAVKASALIASPAGAMLALPAVYQYVMQVVAQARELQSVQTA